jgi:hypothetical protein
MGHMTFGLHEHVPRPSAYLTLLRDPVALVRSQYRHVRRHEGHLLHERAKAYPDLAAYVESGLSLEMDNSQTRAFAGDTSTPFGDCDPSMLERAKANLQTFAVAGITERFDESIVAMIRAFGWRRLRYVAVNVDPSGGARAPLTARELEVVSQHNVFDLELYDWADARFRRDVIGSARFDDDLGAFRARNRRHAPIGKLVAAPRASIERLRSR